MKPCKRIATGYLALRVTPSIANDLQEGNRIGADSYSGGQSAYRNIGRGGNTYIETTGEGHAENMPPYLGVNYIIKT